REEIPPQTEKGRPCCRLASYRERSPRRALPDRSRRVRRARSASSRSAKRRRRANPCRQYRSSFAERPASSISTGFETRTAFIKARLNVHDTELPVLGLAVRCHHPHKIYRVPRNRNVRMKSARHHDRIAVANDADKLGILGVRVDKLNAERRSRHVVIDIKF